MTRLRRAVLVPGGFQRETQGLVDMEWPDRRSFRLVSRVYQAFGLYEDDIARFDRKTGRLVLD